SYTRRAVSRRVQCTAVLAESQHRGIPWETGAANNLSRAGSNCCYPPQRWLRDKEQAAIEAEQDHVGIAADGDRFRHFALANVEDAHAARGSRNISQVGRSPVSVDWSPFAQRYQEKRE